MKAEIIAVGTEILLGEIVDTDSQYIAARLPALGIDLFWVTQVGDNLERAREALERAWQRSDLIFTTGGLGPTEDDLTREAIAAMLGEEMRVEPSLEAHLREFFARRGRPMPERNVKQATLIPSARAIPNAYGTAPGWWVEREGRVIVAMPGPPGEMRRMWEAEVEPELRRRSQRHRARLAHAEDVRRHRRAASTSCWATSSTPRTRPSASTRAPTASRCASPPRPPTATPPKP